MKKKKYIRKYVACVASLLMSFGFLQFPEKSYAADHLDIHADAAILVEESTGKILYEKNADEVLGIASMTKMMTEYLLFEAIKEKKISWDQKYQVSDYVYKVSQDLSLSNVPLRKDATYTIRELYEAMAIYSANAATIAIAESIAGSETEFIKLMNKKAKELGLKDYKFVNSSGLNNKDLKGMHPKGTKAEEENMMSARSTAKLAAHLVQDFPEVIKTASTPKKIFREGTEDELPMENWNFMLPSLVYGYEGVDGLKTGTTDFAGFCFTGTAERDGMRVITVVMNAVDKNGNGTFEARFNETKKLMDYAYNNFSVQELYPAKYKIKKNESLPVSKGKDKEVQIHTKSPLKVVIKNNEKDSYKPIFTVDEKKVNNDGALNAVVKKGETVGTLTAKNGDNDKLGYLETEPSVNVVTEKEVEKANWFTLSIRGIGGFIGDLWGSATKTVKGWF